MSRPSSYHFFFNDTASTVIYTLSLHDALPIFHAHSPREAVIAGAALARELEADHLLAVGGGSVTDATKTMLLALWRGASGVDALSGVAGKGGAPPPPALDSDRHRLTALATPLSP